VEVKKGKKALEKYQGMLVKNEVEKID